jgi:uncharacterized tellurite resistance protein B-like protein
MARAIKKTEAQKEAQKKSNEKYDAIHQQLMDYLLSGELRSTLVGKLISMDHSDEGISEVEDYVEYVVDQLRNAENYSNRKAM